MRRKTLDVKNATFDHDDRPVVYRRCLDEVIFRRFQSLLVFRSSKNILLQLGRETDEELTEASNADDEVLILLGVLLGSEQVLGVDYVDLHFLPPWAKKTLSIVRSLSRSALLTTIFS